MVYNTYRLGEKIENTEDIEEFDHNNDNKRARKGSKCKQCSERKKNQLCNLNMCLPCCSVHVDPCNIKEHDLFKQKNWQERRQHRDNYPAVVTSTYREQLNQREVSL
jgi:hypothetical protein